jgi:hypothetical protein
MSFNTLIILCIFSVQWAFASNGDFITAQHSWSKPAQSIVPLYIGVDRFKKNLEALPKGQLPQPSCTGTLIKNGTRFLSAAHCYRAMCVNQNVSPKTKITDYFILVNDQKIFFKENPMHPKYCEWAFTKDYAKKMAPNSFFPEWAYDVSVAKISKESAEYIQAQIRDFPKLRLEATDNEYTETLTQVGYGVSDRYTMMNTLNVDKDKDGVHDYWDMCPDTQMVLHVPRKKYNFDHNIKSNGCSENQELPSPAIAMDYFSATQVSHKRGFQFTHFEDTEILFKEHRVRPEPFIVNHGYRGSLYPYKNLQPLAFGGDSGSPVLDKNLGEVVALTILYYNPQKFVVNYAKYIKEKTGRTIQSSERRDLMNSGFNIFLKLSHNKDFILGALK